MTIELLASDQRGYANHGWLDTHHSFSFAHYYNPSRMGFLDLRVINDDVVKAGAGFPTHGHENMEIITYMVRGELAHKDSTGSEGTLKRGDVQMMSAGAGVRHSEFNASKENDLRLLQIWVLPASENTKPSYGQDTILDAEKRNTLRLLVGPKSENVPLKINQNLKLFASILDADQTLNYSIAKERAGWIQIVDGEIDVNGVVMKSGDGASIEGVEALQIKANKETEFLLFDLVK